MNNRDSIKTKMAAVEKRYGKTIKGTKSGKTKPKFKIKPILGKDKIGIKIKGTF